MSEIDIRALPGKTIDKVEIDHGTFTKETYEARGLDPVSSKFSNRTVRLIFTDGTSHEFKCES
jgi:hypothetical protein